MKVGEVGWFDKTENGRRNYFRYEFKAYQIVDQSNALVQVSLASFTAQGLSNTPKLLWISGIDTSKLDNGGDVEFSGLIAVVGNKTYETPSGTNTVLLLKVIDPKPYADLFKRKGDTTAEKKTAQDKVPAPADCEANFRKWTSSNGNHVVEALLSSYANGSVTLETRDGKKVKVDLTKLSEADQAYVTKWKREKN